MSILAGYWTLYAGANVSAGVYGMTEGMTPAEASLSDATVVDGFTTTNWVTVLTYNLPDPIGGIIKAGTYEVILRAYGTIGSPIDVRVILDGDAGSYTATSDTVAVNTTTEADRVFTITVGADQTKSTWILKVQHTHATGPWSNFYVRPIHANVRFGAQTGATGTPRSAFSASPYTPAVGTHIMPTMIPTGLPAITLDCAGVYPDDHLTLVKYTDTLSTAAHSASGATTQTVGHVVDYTTSFPSAGVRRITGTADSTRKMDGSTNTYYVMTVKDGADGAVGTLAYELLLAVGPAQLTTLNGSAAGSYVVTDDLMPYVEWIDANAETTHWRVKVYNTSDAEMWDSTETAVGETRVQIPSGTLAASTTYYAVVTLMNGSGGSNWTLDSARGYFQIAAGATGVKITSHEGTLADPTLETDTTPLIEWSFERTQQSFNLSIVDESDQSVDYSTGWTASATKSHTVGSALTPGKTYSIQVQVKDAQQAHVYSSDKRAYIHVNDAAVAAPVLTAEADTDSLTSVTLAWTGSVITDGDALTYELELTGVTTQARTFNASSATSLEVGRLPIDTFTWKVRATDEHGMVGAWSSTDTFVVADGGALPVATLVSRPTSAAPLVTNWTYFDADSDTQTAYQVQLATDAGFTAIVEDSGTVVSTALFYSATITTAQTYYRRVKVRTGATNWSDWSTADSTEVIGPTTQTSDVEVYLNAEGTPAALDQTTYPVSGMSVTFKANAPAECKFTVNNFDALEGGIDDDEEVLVYLKDSAGKRISFRGAVVSKDVGHMLTVTARDISRLFDRWRVTRTLSYMTLGQVIEAIVEDPTGSTSTGITAHCEEVQGDNGVVTIRTFTGQAKTLAAWLGDFASATGYFWRMEYIAGAWHFWWYNPATQPTYAVTLKDNIDRANNSASQWRIGDEVRVVKDRSQYANRIMYSGIPDPPVPPLGIENFDQVFTEAVTSWGIFTDAGETTWGVTNTAGYVQRGAYGMIFTWNHAQDGTHVAWDDIIPICYRRIPADLQDMYHPAFGSLVFDLKMTVKADTAQLYSSVGSQPAEPKSDYYNVVKPNLRPVVFVFTSESALAAPGSLKVNAVSALDSGSWIMDKDPSGAWDSWQTYEFPLPGNMFVGDVDAYKHVIAIGFGLRTDGRFDAPTEGERYAGNVRSGHEQYIQFAIDDVRIEPNKVSNQPIDRYVETAAVTTGAEQPVETPLGVTGLNQSSASILAATMLTYRNRTQQSVQSVTVDGIRNIPRGSQIPLVLPNHGIASDTLAMYEITFLPFDSGDRTEVAVGDPKLDVAKALAGLRQKLDSLVGGTL